MLLLTLALLMIGDLSIAQSRQAIALIETERAFARMASSAGTRKAFLTYLADDGVLFRPGPMAGKDFLSAQADDERALSWAPSHYGISRGNDFGFTTGPWEHRAPGEVSTVATGSFLSVWSLGTDSTWKLVLDVGTSHPVARPLPVDVAPLPVGVPTECGPDVDYDYERAQLMAYDSTLSARAALEGAGRALQDVADPQVRVYRPGAPPSQGLGGLRAAMAAHPPSSWRPVHARVARQGDLAYTYGTYGDDSAKQATAGYYVRLWSRDAAGRWRLLVDLANPLAPQQEK